jgi:hypothetical protein
LAKASVMQLVEHQPKKAAATSAALSTGISLKAMF